MIIQPLRNNVALKEIAKESKSSSGIVLMGASEETPQFGVIAIGPEVKCVEVNDRVYIKMAKASLVDSGTLMIEDKFIIAVIE